MDRISSGKYGLVLYNPSTGSMSSAFPELLTVARVVYGLSRLPNPDCEARFLKVSRVEARKSGHDSTPLSNLRKREHQNELSLLHVPTFCSLYFYAEPLGFLRAEDEDLTIRCSSAARPPI